MRPTGGTVAWDDSTRIKQLRAASAVVDAPGVNEPEQHLSVHDLVTEDLALIPRRFRGALLSGTWLKVNRFEDIADSQVEDLPADRRLELLTALALMDPHTDLLVVDSPDRHSGYPADWLPRLCELAYDGGRPLAVVATVGAVPPGWTGPVAGVGNAVPAPVAPDPVPDGAPASPADPATEPVPEFRLDPETEDAR
jgi:hypothetical protein